MDLNWLGIGMGCLAKSKGEREEANRAVQPPTFTIHSRASCMRNIVAKLIRALTKESTGSIYKHNTKLKLSLWTKIEMH